MRKAGLPLQRLLTLQHLTAVAGYFKQPDVSALYAAVGEKTVGAQAVVNRLITVEGGEDMAADETSEDRVVTGRQRRIGSASRTESGIQVMGPAICWSSWPSAAPRCRATRSSASSPRAPGSRCTGPPASTPTACAAEPERLVTVAWAPTAKSSFLVAIQVEALDRNRLLSDITRALSDQHVNILSAALNTSKDRICKAKFTFETADPKHLDHVLRAIRSVDAVYDVYRINQ